MQIYAVVNLHDLKNVELNNSKQSWKLDCKSKGEYGNISGAWHFVGYYPYVYAIAVP